MHPRQEAQLLGVALRDGTPAPGGPLYFFSPPLPSPESHSSFKSIHFALFPCSSAICVHACLLACVSHRSPLRSRQLSRGDAWVPPVNFTAFIWPDEWLAALSVPLPAISSGSLELLSACGFGHFLQQGVLVAHTTQRKKQEIEVHDNTG